MAVNPPSFGFIIHPVDGGTFAIMVTSSASWYVSGFDSKEQAFSWLLDYMTTTNDLANRLTAEREDRRRAEDEELRARLALAMEPKVEKGKEN